MLLPIVIDLCVLQANLDCLIKTGGHLLYIKTLIMSRNCKNNPDLFCYICGKFTPKSKRRPISDFVKDSYIKKFQSNISDLKKNWTPNICCNSCRLGFNDKNFTMETPMIWREPKDHTSDCYFCSVDLPNFRSVINASKCFNYPQNIESAILPTFRDMNIFVDSHVDNKTEWKNDFDTDEEYLEENFENNYDGRNLHLLDQSDLSDIFRDANLNKEQSELIASRLKQFNLLKKDTRVTFYRNREEKFSNFYNDGEENMVYTNKITEILTELCIPIDHSQWRLFIDSSVLSLKAVLLHNGNFFRPIPLAYITNTKESYDSISKVLTSINYNNFKWKICGDLKVIAFVLGLQQGYTKYSCFLCEWDSRYKEDQYEKKIWPERKKLVTRLPNFPDRRIRYEFFFLNIVTNEKTNF